LKKGFQQKGRKVLLLRLGEGIFSHVDGFLLGRLKAPRGMRINSDFKQASLGKKKNLNLQRPR